MKRRKPRNRHKERRAEGTEEIEEKAPLELPRVLMGVMFVAQGLHMVVTARNGAEADQKMLEYTAPMRAFMGMSGPVPTVNDEPEDAHFEDHYDEVEIIDPEFTTEEEEEDERAA